MLDSRPCSIWNCHFTMFRQTHCKMVYFEPLRQPVLLLLTACPPPSTFFMVEYSSFIWNIGSIPSANSPFVPNTKNRFILPWQTHHRFLMSRPTGWEGNTEKYSPKQHAHLHPLSIPQSPVQKLKPKPRSRLLVPLSCLYIQGYGLKLILTVNSN